MDKDQANRATEIVEEAVFKLLVEGINLKGVNMTFILYAIQHTYENNSPQEARKWISSLIKDAMAHYEKLIKEKNNE